VGPLSRSHLDFSRYGTGSVPKGGRSASLIWLRQHTGIDCDHCHPRQQSARWTYRAKGNAQVLRLLRFLDAH
jgi:hypothetical protein